MRGVVHPRNVKTTIAIILLLLFVAPTTASEEPVYLTAYPVDNLAVWRLDKVGHPEFDASVLIAYLKPHFEPDTAFKVVNDRMIIVSATSTGHKKIREALERLRAFADQDIQGELKQQQADAAISIQHILIFVSDPNSAAAKQFFDAQFDDENQDLQRALDNYTILCVRSTNTDALNDLRLHLSSERESLLAVLSAQGDILKTTAIDSSTVDRVQVAEVLTELLVQQWNTLPNAAETLATAYESAAKGKKKVLVQVSGPNCGPCFVLSKYLKTWKTLLEKDYVLVKVDIRMPDADSVIARLREERNGSIPWMGILSDSGEVLATSDGEKGNIGYPRSEASQSHFREMLDVTSQRLTEDEKDALIEGCEKAWDMQYGTKSNSSPP